MKLETLAVQPLQGMTVVTLAINLPGPVAACRLKSMGAKLIKIEPPGGDPMEHYQAQFYRDLSDGQEVIRLDLKSPEGLVDLKKHLAKADLLLTAQRPSALARLGLDWDSLKDEFSHLSQVAIIGYPRPKHEEPGHDLTYMAKLGLLSPPELPKTLIADMSGGEQAAQAGLACLLGRERGQGTSYIEIALSEAARDLAAPLRYGMTAPGSILTGAFGPYNIYQAKQDWVAVAALEPHFHKGLEDALGVKADDPEILKPVFLQKTADEWETWAAERDIPLVSFK